MRWQYLLAIYVGVSSADKVGLLKQEVGRVDSAI